jgi:hypothetical protein
MGTKRYIEIEDDSDPSAVYVFEVDFLLSSWRCTYGGTCKGVLDHLPAKLGCCQYGVHLTKGDRKRLRKLVVPLAESGLWENAAEAAENGWWERTENDELNTVIYKGACIFANHSEELKGCSLIRYGMQQGVEFGKYWPQTCRIAPFVSNVAEHYSGKEHTFIVPWNHYTWDYAREGHAYGEWSCTCDADNYSEARTPVFYRFKHELAECSTPEVVEQLQSVLEQEFGMSNLPAAVPVQFNGRKDGRLPLPV